MECTTVPGEKGISVVTDLCWVNEKTLIGAQTLSKQILKFTIDTNIKACLTEVLVESSEDLYDVSCSKDEIIVSYFNKIRAYNITTMRFEEWQYPDVIGVNKLAIYDDLVVLAYFAGNKVYIRDNLAYLYGFDHGGKEKGARSNYLTINDIYWVCTYSSPPELIQVDLNANVTSVFKYEVISPYYLSGIPGRYVFVTSYNGEQVGVYTDDGHYLKDLQIDNPTQGHLGASAALERLGRDNLIAFGVEASEKSPVKIYTLQP